MLESNLNSPPPTNEQIEAERKRLNAQKAKLKKQSNIFTLGFLVVFGVSVGIWYYITWQCEQIELNGVTDHVTHFTKEFARIGLYFVLAVITGSFLFMRVKFGKRMSSIVELQNKYRK